MDPVNITNSIKNIQSGDTSFLIFIMIALIVLLIIITLLYSYYMIHLESSECSRMNTMYPTINNTIHSINVNDPDCGYKLLDYYIKTAYNCCNGGKYKNDFVDLCNLNAVIRNGVRCLDFEIYSVGDQPVISSSTESNYHIKETFNYVKFSDAINTIVQNCFSNSTSPNPADPVILHLRIKSSNQTMFDNLAEVFKSIPADLLLPPEYGSENSTCDNETNQCFAKNIAKMNLTYFMGKILIIIDKSNTDFLDNAKLYPYVNLTSNSMFMRALSYYDTRYTPDIDELTEYNKLCMTIVMPDNGSSPENPSGALCREMGCQMVAMRYTDDTDDSLIENEMFFNQKGYAFVLKPELLRYVPVTIETAPPNDPLLNFEARTTSTDYYSFQT
jgi:hypothetical protein